jgi:hypothetical protein
MNFGDTREFITTMFRSAIAVREKSLMRTPTALSVGLRKSMTRACASSVMSLNMLKQLDTIQQKEELKMKIKTVTRSVTTADIPEIGELTLNFTPCDWLDTHVEVVGNKCVVGYLVHDDDAQNPMKDWDGEGELITEGCGVITDGNPSPHLGLKEMPNRYGMYRDLDCDGVYDLAVELMTPTLLNDEDFLEFCIEEYENNNEHDNKEEYLLDCISSIDWGEYGTCIPPWLEAINVRYQELAWDQLFNEGKIGTYLAVPVNYCDSNHGPGTTSAGSTDLSNANAVWIPGKCELDNMGFTEGMTYAEKLVVAAKYADSALDTYVMWCNGDCYGVVVETFECTNPDRDDYDEAEWERIDEDACWGFIGSDHAESSLKSDYFDHVVNTLKGAENGTN